MNKQLIHTFIFIQKAVTGFGQRNLFGDGNVETLAKFYGLTMGQDGASGI